MKIAFTGHREYEQEQFDEALREAVISQLRGGDEVTTFLSGMAVGFDLAAAELVLELRDEGESVELCCVVPYEGQSLRFSDEDMERYDEVLRRADSVVVIAEEYSKEVFFRRNDYLVESADLVIAYYDGGRSGGTAYTVRRARHARVGVENIYPQVQLQLFKFR